MKSTADTLGKQRNRVFDASLVLQFRVRDDVCVSDIEGNVESAAEGIGAANTQDRHSATNDGSNSGKQHDRRFKVGGVEHNNAGAAERPHGAKQSRFRRHSVGGYLEPRCGEAGLFEEVERLSRGRF